jgi:hypothetical protein
MVAPGIASGKTGIARGRRRNIQYPVGPRRKAEPNSFTGRERQYGNTESLHTERKWLVRITAALRRSKYLRVPPMPDDMRAAARTMGKERRERFVESLSRRMEAGSRLFDVGNSAEDSRRDW